jgi:hypothetical protein
MDQEYVSHVLGFGSLDLAKTGVSATTAICVLKEKSKQGRKRNFWVMKSPLLACRSQHLLGI